MKDEPGPIFVPLLEAVQILNNAGIKISIRTIRNKIYQRKWPIPVIRIDNRIYFRQDELHQYLDQLLEGGDPNV